MGVDSKKTEHTHTQFNSNIGFSIVIFNNFFSLNYVCCKVCENDWHSVVVWAVIVLCLVDLPCSFQTHFAVFSYFFFCIQILVQYKYVKSVDDDELLEQRLSSFSPSIFGSLQVEPHRFVSSGFLFSLQATPSLVRQKQFFLWDSQNWVSRMCNPYH